MTTLEDLAKRIVAFRDARQWKQFHTPKDMAISLMLEAAETAELFQWKSESELSPVSAEMKIKLGAELSDVLYWVLLLAHDFDIDLQLSFEQKMLSNESKYPIEKATGMAKKYDEL